MGVEIALAVGLTGFTATLAGAAINAGVGLALSWGAQNITGSQQGAAASSPAGVQVSLQVRPDMPRIAVVGETATAGVLKYWHLTGDNNERLCLVISLADHECDSLRGVIVNGVFRSWDSETGVVADTGGTLRVKFHSGAAGQVADAEVMSGSGGAWTANERGTGICYVVAFIDYSEAQWPGGIPDLLFVLRGHKQLVDPRTGLRGYSDNWGVVIHNALLGIRQTVNGPRVVGLHTPAGAIKTSDVLAACAASDEAVARATGGTEARYRVGAALYSNMTAREVLERLTPAGAGEIVESGGLWRVIAGVAQTPVASLTDADFVIGQPLSYEPRLPRSELVNSVEGTWLDSGRAFVASPLPPRSSAADIAADGGTRLATALDLSSCPSRSQAQRVMEIARRRARRQGRLACTVRARWQELEPGDCVSVTSDRLGIVGGTFVVRAAEEAPDGNVQVTLAETDAGVDDWSFADEIADNAALDLPSGGPPTANVLGVSLATFTAAALGGAQRPGLVLTWTPVLDPTAERLLVEFRRVGDAEAVQRVTVFEPASGSHAWVSGVMGGVSYEARARAVTRPERASQWSPWVTTQTTAPQIVEIATLATSVPPESVTHAHLSQQAQLELSLASASADVEGSAAFHRRWLEERFERVALSIDTVFDAVDSTNTLVTTTQRTFATEREALAEQITSVVATLEGETAVAIQDLRSRVEVTESGVSSQADLIAAVQTTLDGHTASISSAIQSIDGISARWVLDINTGGRARRLVTIGGSENTDSVVFEVDHFTLGRADVNGGAPFPVFSVDTSGPTPRAVLAGDFFATGSISAQHLNTTTLHTLYIQDPAGVYFYDFANGRQGATDGSVTFDMKNKLLEWVF